jgi:Na+/H+-translocating membrane pyrophosphatase
MESVLNVSFWGVLLLILTTLRLTWLLGSGYNAGQVRAALTALHHQADRWFRSAYKPFTVLIISGLILSACYAATGDRYLETGQTALVFGLGSVGLGVLMTTLLADLRRALHISLSLQEDDGHRISAGKALVTVRNLVICLVSLLLVLLRQPYEKWGLFPTLSVLAGFALGASSALLIAYLYRGQPAHATETPGWVSRLLKPHRLDMLAGAIAATMLLGAGLSEVSAIGAPAWASGPVMLPVVLAVNGVIVSSITALLTGSHFEHIVLSYRSVPQKLLNALLMGGITLGAIKCMLANHWVLGGREYHALHVFYTVLAGIAGGLVFHEAGRFYSYCRVQYHAYFRLFSTKEWLVCKVLRLVVRTVYMVLPPVIAALFFLVAFQYAGLYGIMLSLVAMLSNLTTRFGETFRT